MLYSNIQSAKTMFIKRSSLVLIALAASLQLKAAIALPTRDVLPDGPSIRVVSGTLNEYPRNLTSFQAITGASTSSVEQASEQTNSLAARSETATCWNSAPWIELNYLQGLTYYGVVQVLLGSEGKTIQAGTWIGVWVEAWDKGYWLNQYCKGANWDSPGGVYQRDELFLTIDSYWR
ncbi:hypothetical protein B0O99DRAFT_597262 [Bisporella sp. PMI_857]|nr:hypothetical protein B0O99DRAFT_597262 [Bisporella sp. PMI_857]